VKVDVFILKAIALGVRAVIVLRLAVDIGDASADDGEFDVVAC